MTCRELQKLSHSESSFEKIHCEEHGRTRAELREHGGPGDGPLVELHAGLDDPEGGSEDRADGPGDGGGEEVEAGRRNASNRDGKRMDPGRFWGVSIAV